MGFTVWAKLIPKFYVKWPKCDSHCQTWGKFSRKRNFSFQIYWWFLIWIALRCTEISKKTLFNWRFKIWSEGLCVGWRMWSSESVYLQIRSSSICHITYRFNNIAYCVPKKENINNLYMHLTNYAINKNSEKF